jgi:hypothetical protein
LFELLHCLSFRGHFEAEIPAGIRLAVERLGNRSRAAYIAEKQDFDMKVAGFVCHSHHVANPNFACGLRELPIELDSAEITGSRSKSSRLEEPGGPEPFVDPYRGHGLFSYECELFCFAAAA